MRSPRRASSGSPHSPRFSPLLQYCLFGYIWIYGAATAFYVAIHVFSMLRSAISVLSNFVHLLSTFNFQFSTSFFFLAVLLLLDNQFSLGMLPLNSSDCSMRIPYQRSCRNQLRVTSESSRKRFSTKRCCPLSRRRLRSSVFDRAIPNSPHTIGQAFRFLPSVDFRRAWLPRLSVASALRKWVTRQFMPTPASRLLYPSQHSPPRKASSRELRPPLVSSLSSVPSSLHIPSPIHSSSSTSPFGSPRSTLSSPVPSASSVLSTSSIPLVSSHPSIPSASQFSISPICLVYSQVPMSSPPIEPTAPASTITNIYHPVILRPNEPGAPHFIGENVSEFLEEWDFFCDDYGCDDRVKCTRLPLYCDKKIGDDHKRLDGFVTEDWAMFRSSIIGLYWQHDKPKNT